MISFLLFLIGRLGWRIANMTNYVKPGEYVHYLALVAEHTLNEAGDSI